MLGLVEWYEALSSNTSTTKKQRKEKDFNVKT
jgi:hypothetical protein